MDILQQLNQIAVERDLPLEELQKELEDSLAVAYKRFVGATGEVTVEGLTAGLASFAFTETRLGILPAVVSPYVVRKIGPARATALFVTGSRIDAKRAHEIGLVERLVEPSDLDAAVGRVLDAIVSGGPKAVNAAKRLVREVEGRRIDEIADLTVKRIAEIRVSHEGQEGLRAFLERREPHW